MDINSLDINDLVKFINLELNKNKNLSLNKLADKCGIKRSTLKSRLHRENYMYNAADRSYKKTIKKQLNDKKTKTSEPKNTKVNIIPKEKNISSNSTLDISPFTAEDLKELLKMKKDLKNIIENYNISINDNKSNNLEIDISKFSKEVSSRLVKVYSNVNSQWIEFCKKHNQYKMQDLYSLALIEFIEKYN
ncbi:hypothetical protein KQI36_15840 [Clostridium senegalense]|uniref:hypothetical protein n=1 Tax=Clostridium senegalense TaxID=1465809 RepID=UPI001C109D20|nr:hypothetical protein [Clostridium senegalense]MBU5228104.1 hypothetical protein [Clostridium senegalense]